MRPRTFPFTRHLSPDFGIDLGTSCTRISLPQAGVALDEPTLVAWDRARRRVAQSGRAVGNLAKLMEGRTAGAVETLTPVRRGVVADTELCSAMLRAFLQKVPRRGWWGPRVLLAVSAGLTPVERQAALAAVARSGARQVALISKVKAAALGAALPIVHPVASLICDIGSGSGDIAILSLADVVVCESLRVAGSDLDHAIADHLQRTHKLRVGSEMAERIKIEIGSVTPLASELEMEVSGRDIVSGLPRRIALSSDEVREALEPPLQMILRAVSRTVESAQPELAADLMQNGIVLAGGTAQLRGLDHRVAKTVGIPARVVDEPEQCVARGLATCLENLDVWQAMIERSAA